MAGPLTGITVVEIASFISGPYAGLLLADLGAEVIKIETPAGGDPFRRWTPTTSGPSSIFVAFNHGKKSVALDLKTDAGRDACERLIRGADVLIQNYRPGVLDRLGLSYENLSRSNSRLIYCAISGMGRTGPASQLPTYDAIGQATSGYLSLITDDKNPVPIGPAVSDQLTGMFATISILAALTARGADGRGQRIDLSMFAATLAFLVDATTAYLLEGKTHSLTSRPHSSQSYAFLAGDGVPLVIHLSSPPKFWQGLLEATGRTELLDDPRFRTKADRVANYDALRAELASVFQTKSRDEWLRLLHEQDVPAAPLNSIAEALAYPATSELNLLKTYGNSGRGVELVGFPAAFSDLQPRTDLPAPHLGEHTAEVLDRLGLGRDRVRMLVDALPVAPVATD